MSFTEPIVSDKNEQTADEINSARDERNKITMRKDTKEMLVRFYAPFNRELANLTKDKRMLWTDALTQKTTV